MVGYARSSTIEQEAGYQAQIKALKAHGCEKVFAEQVSSVAKREQLEAALDYVRQGDVFIVTKLDRLARSVVHLPASRIRPPTRYTSRKPRPQLWRWLRAAVAITR